MTGFDGEKISVETENTIPNPFHPRFYVSFVEILQRTVFGIK